MNNRYRTIVRHDGVDYFGKEYTLDTEEVIEKQKQFLFDIATDESPLCLNQSDDSKIMFPSNVIKNSIITLSKVKF